MARGTYTDSGAPDEGRRVEADAERSILMHSDVAIRGERYGESEFRADVPDLAAYRRNLVVTTKWSRDH